jgi:hypothetical protein
MHAHRLIGVATFAFVSRVLSEIRQNIGFAVIDTEHRGRVRVVKNLFPFRVKPQKPPQKEGLVYTIAPQMVLGIRVNLANERRQAGIGELPFDLFLSRNVP